jgi:hypothetical protein
MSGDQGGVTLEDFRAGLSTRAWCFDMCSYLHSANTPLQIPGLVHEQSFDSRFKGLDCDAGRTMMRRVRAEPAALYLAVGEV